MMIGFNVCAIIGSQFLKIFEITVSVTLNLKAMSSLVTPKRSFINTASR